MRPTGPGCGPVRCRIHADSRPPGRNGTSGGRTSDCRAERPRCGRHALWPPVRHEAAVRWRLRDAPAMIRHRSRTRGVAAQHASLSRWRSPVRIRSGPPSSPNSPYAPSARPDGAFLLSRSGTLCARERPRPRLRSPPPAPAASGAHPAGRGAPPRPRPAGCLPARGRWLALVVVIALGLSGPRRSAVACWRERRRSGDDRRRPPVRPRPDRRGRRRRRGSRRSPRPPPRPPRQPTPGASASAATRDARARTLVAGRTSRSCPVTNFRSARTGVRAADVKGIAARHLARTRRSCSWSGTPTRSSPRWA